jgi:hypothetical protein
MSVLLGATLDIVRDAARPLTDGEAGDYDPLGLAGMVFAGGIGGLVVGGLTGAIKRTRWDRDPAQFLLVAPGSDYLLVIVRASPASARRETSRVLGTLVRSGAMAFLDPTAYYATHPQVEEALTPA